MNSNKAVSNERDVKTLPYSENKDTPIFWDPNKSNEFLANLDRSKISHLIENFETLTLSQVTNDLKQVMKDSA